MTSLTETTPTKSDLTTKLLLDHYHEESRKGRTEADMIKSLTELTDFKKIATQEISTKAFFEEDFESFEDFLNFSRFFKALLHKLGIDEEAFHYEPASIPSLESLKYRGNNKLDFQRSKTSHAQRFERH